MHVWSQNLCYYNDETRGVLPANNLACFLFGCLEMHFYSVIPSVLDDLSAGKSWEDGNHTFSEITDV